jgi:HSP20 family protein
MFALRPWRENEMVAFPLPRLRDEFKVLYDRLFNGLPMLLEPNREPERFWNLEVTEAEREVVVRAEVPGFEAADLNVELRNNRLLIRAETKHETEAKEKGYEYTERRYERFVELPVEVDPAKVAATYRNGVLEVHLPKMAEAEVRRIPVK